MCLTDMEVKRPDIKLLCLMSGFLYYLEIYYLKLTDNSLLNKFCDYYIVG